MSLHTIDIPVGPHHPALKEPGNFMLSISGEKITGVKVNLGYNHRGIEKACEDRTYLQNIYLLERICGICSHTHATCFALGVEELAGITAPRRAQYIRTLVAELERIHSHFLWLGVAAHEIGFDTLLMYTWRDREKVLDLLSAITGNRVNYSINTIGGVRRDISPEIARKTLEVINEVEERTQYYIKIALEETTLKNRLSGVGILSKEDARSYGAVGPTLRASGIAQDVRKDDPYIAYSELDFNVCTSDQCDVFGRTVVRLLELLESFKMIRQIIDGLPEGDIAAKAPRKIPESEVTSRYEAPRGECLHYIRSNGTDKPDRVKVRAPSLANFQSVPKMMEDRFIADSTIIIAAIDPCFSCTDRMISIKGEGPRAGLSSWEDLRLHGIEWYAGCGVDFKSINLS